ncbi:MAG: helix-turn-helix transcriptional regulator [Lachnospiraceae bacterium]|nr:helix-turn-helix transcriptional regulator [Lachnospiraceae bacterium]
MNSSRYDRVRRFAEIHYEARLRAGKSQEYMALELGVAKKTVQNWEKGVSSPSFFQSLEWFRVIGINPYPYYMSILYPEELLHIKPTDDDEKIDRAFEALIRSIAMDDKRALLYLYNGAHGSSPHAILQLLLCHLHSPMSFRINNACGIETAYKLAEELNTIVCPDNIRPDLSNFRDSINRAIEACKNNTDRYTSL